MLTFMVVLIMLFNLMPSRGSNMVDGYGHCGGAITGLLWGMAFFPRARSEGGNTLRKIGMVGVVTFFVLNFVLFYTVRKPLG